MLILFIASILSLSAIVFYKTIITKEWRNVVPHEADHWRGVFIYVNKDDPRYILPKRTGLGWTINFGQPMAVVMLLLAIVAIVSFANLRFQTGG